MRTYIAIAWIAFQSLVVCAWTVYEARRLLPGRGESIVVRTVPVDPRDLLRGQYIQLRYEFSSMPWETFDDTAASRDVWVVLVPEVKDGQTYHVPTKFSFNKPHAFPPEAVVIRGRDESYNELSFGVERYFVPEGTETPDPSEITVRLRIGDDHRARIERVYVKGKPWP